MASSDLPATSEVLLQTDASKHILDDFAESLAEVAVVEKAPKVEGRSISMVLAEKK